MSGAQAGTAALDFRLLRPISTVIDACDWPPAIAPRPKHAPAWRGSSCGLGEAGAPRPPMAHRVASVVSMAWARPFRRIGVCPVWSAGLRRAHVGDALGVLKPLPC